jgi:hypothetical protein
MFLDTRLGNTPRWFLEPPKDWAMRVPEQIRSNVVFLGEIEPRGDERSTRFAGTGFFALVPSVASPDRGYLYLVTAKHVVDQLSRGDWVMRANTNDGRSMDVQRSSGHQWWFHPEEPDDTDVAVTPLGLDGNEFDFSACPVSMFVTEEHVRPSGVIGAGDEIFTVGLFNRMIGRSRNSPIVRMGNVAMIPDPGERVPGITVGIDRVAEAEVYLIEARSNEF